MSSLPFEVHEVLEQEYVSMHGPIDVPSSEYEAADVIDESWALAVLATCGITVGTACPDDVKKLAMIRIKAEAPDNDAIQAATKTMEIVSALNELVRATDVRVLEKLSDSPALTSCGRDLIGNYDDYTSGVTELRRFEINRCIVDDAFHGAVKRLRDVRLGALYTKIHKRGEKDATARTALCISGGGIRSATFALGVVQGLAGAGILKKFDYLSTVSGGGYIGSWLSSWARRHPKGIAGVEADMVRADTAVEGPKPDIVKSDLPTTKIDPEPRPIRHLRDYSNYLSPKLGFLSGDTWTMAALYVRNLLLNLLVLVPILAALLAIPRFFAMLMRADPSFGRSALLVVVVGALTVGFGYLGFARPTVHGRHASIKSLRGSAGFVGFCLIPLLVAAIALSLYWAKIAAAISIRNVLLGDWMLFAAAALAMSAVPAAIYYIRFFRQTAAERREPLERQAGWARKAGYELLATIVGLGTVSALFYLIAKKVFDQPVQPVVDPTQWPPYMRPLLDATPISALYICFSVPLILLAFFVQNAAFVGISSKVNEDYDREWWGRGGALILMTAVLLALACFISVFGPVLLYKAPLLVSSVGGVSGILAGLLGFSAKTPAGDKEKQEKSSKSTAVSGLALAFAVPLFVVVFLAAISLGTTVLIRLFREQKVPAVTRWMERFESTATLTQTAELMPGAKFEAKTEADKTPYLSLATVNGVNHLITVHATDHNDLMWILIVAAGAVVLSICIGVNRFSMHSLYRNRLIRAYLGASRYERDPDGFTGFDPHDNLQMYQLRPDLLWLTSFKDVGEFVKQLRENYKKPGVEQDIWNALDKKTRHWLEDGRSVTNTLVNSLIQNVNKILVSEDLGGGVEGESAAARLSRNRKTLETTFATSINPKQHVPMHVINTALNLTAGEKLAWQQRQAESFTVTPLHSGSVYVGYRDSKEYGGDDGISIGTAVTISGAAASPNQGYHSSPAMAFLLTVLNVRLGSWLGNPGIAGKGSYDKANPKSNLHPLALELTGTSNDQSSLVYLSDGGHFENLGIYEMVLRRCRYIVVSDAGCDPTFNFEDLGNAIRKIRTDLGVPIDIQTYMFPRKPDAAFPEGRYVATARIRYSAIDEAPTEIVDGKPQKKDIDGTLVYIKAGLYSEAYFPKDVYNYAASSADFPHESTADQFFSESQFESYRALGRHAVNEICGNYDDSNPVRAFATGFDSVAAFARSANDKSRRDESFDIRIAKQNAPNLPLAIAVSATPNARLVIR